MTGTPPPPPGHTATGPDPADERAETRTGERTGIDTDNLRDYRLLRRDPHDRKIAGVGGGLARHLDVDPTLVRVVLVVLAIFGGAGIILYGALWLFVPERGSESALIPVGESARNAIVVVALILAVLVALPAGFDGDGGIAVPFVVLAIVLVAVLMARDSSRASAGAAGEPGGAEPAGATGATTYRTAAQRADDHATPPGPPGAPGPGMTGSPGPAYPPPTQKRRGPVLIGLAVTSAALALGVLGLFDVSGTAVPDAAYPALALAVVGAWLVVGSVFGRPGGLVLLGVLALLALSVAQLVEPTYRGERELTERPTLASELAESYDVPAGRAEIDLTSVRDVESLDGRSLAVEVNAGEIVLIVPDEVTVDLDAEVAAGGEVSALGSSRGGWGVEVRERLGVDDPRATMDVDLDVGFGSIVVRRES